MTKSNGARLTTPTTSMIKTAEKAGQSAWAIGHMTAVFNPKEGFESALGAMLRGWLDYADSYQTKPPPFGLEIGNDGFLGPKWESIGKALLGLLNSDIGRFDGETLYRIIRETLRRQGFDPDV